MTLKRIGNLANFYLDFKITSYDLKINKFLFFEN